MRNIVNSKGVTIVEVLAAIFVYMIGLMPLMAVMQQSQISGKQADSAYTAYTIAKNHLERLKSVNFSVLASAGETDTLIDQNGSPNTNGSYSRTTAVAMNYSGFVNLAQVAVSVTYRIQGRQSEPTTVATVMYGG